MAAFLYRMPYGIPGDVTRQSQATIEAHVFNSAAAFGGYGLFGKISSGKFVPVGAGDVAGSVYGLLVRPYPTQGANPSDPLGTAVPPTTGIADVMKRGYASVRVNAGTAALGGAVYIRVATPSGAKVIGGIEAVADGANTILVAGAQFQGAADATGNAEIAFNI
jgi:hypothetical protein